MIEKLFEVNKNDIAPIQFIIEGYEGMATISTIDPHKAIIKFSIIPDFISDITVIINDLKNKYKIVELDNYKEERFLC